MFTKIVPMFKKIVPIIFHMFKKIVPKFKKIAPKIVPVFKKIDSAST